MKKYLKYTSLLGLLILASCTDLSVPSSESGNKALEGIWKLDSGEIFSALGYSNSDIYVSLDKNGTGMFYAQDITTLVSKCVPVTYTALSEKNVSLDSNFLSGITQTWSFTHTDTVLTFTDSTTRTATFSKATSVPDSMICKTFQNIQKISTATPVEEQGPNLIFDGSSLWYQSKSQSGYQLNKLDGTTGEHLADYTFSSGLQSEEIQGSQSTDLWSVSGNNAYRRHTDNTLVDQVDTTSPQINHSTYIETLAYDGTYLWVYGRDTDNKSVFLKIDSDAATNTLVSATEYTGSVRWMAADANNLWIVSFSYPQTVVQLDPATLKAKATYLMPDINLQYQGIAVAGESLYLKAFDYAASPDSTVITKVTP